MLLKSQTIINQEELVCILEAQLKKAKSRLTELTKADTKIKSVVAELESLLSEHPDYKLLVSDRLKLGESETDQTGPVRIEIEQELDQLDTITEKLDSASNFQLVFYRYPTTNTVGVGIYGKKPLGKYGISDSNKFWMDKDLSAYFVEEYGINIDDIKRDFNSETTPQDVVEAYDSLFGEAPPQNTPHTKKIEKIESPYSSGAEIAQLIEAQNRHDQRNQPTEQEISAWDSGHEQVQYVVSPIQSDDEEEKIALVEKVLSELDTFEFSKTRGIPKIAMYIEIQGKSLGMIFTDKGNLLSTVELEENLIRTYALDLPLLLKDVDEGKSITLENYCLSKKSEVGEIQQPSKPTAKATVEQVEMVKKPDPTLSQLKQQLLSKKNKSELEGFKASIGADKALEIWESCTYAERNLIKCINVVADSNRAALPFDLVGWHNAIGKQEIARYVGFYLYGKQVAENERVIYLVKHDTFKIVDRRTLKGVDAKSQKPCPPELVIKLETALEAQPELEQPTADEIASNTFTGLQPAPKQNGSESGKLPEEPPSKLSVEAGDIIEVHTKDSIAYGKTVEVNFVKEDGTVHVDWDGKNVYIPASGYTIFSKGLNLKKI
ncbi:hypothetical protein [Okeania sp. SIO2B3]|uniref:hypothetical protein n=1 Tax=Okeania sp. SIO2B3 TaxID=2607784 RepID=UPI0013C170B9|nr:hypothetical protein [Okeania sp. SIO2B3]NET46773.1 hypothetical protein [Okeania sp. SIO2B3]